MQYETHVVSTTEDGNFPNEVKIILETEDPDGRYRNWYLDYNTSKNGPAPDTGMTINFDAKQNEKKFWRCWGWEVGDPNEVKTNGGAQQIAQKLPDSDLMRSIQAVNQPVQVNSALTKEASMFVMGTVGRWVGNQKDFPQQEELTGMIQNAKHAYLKGMKNDSES